MAVSIFEATPNSNLHEGPDSDAALAAAGDRTACDRMRAEELTQDVFVRAWEKLHLFRGESSFGTWIHRLAVNVVLNSRKSEGRRWSRVEDDEEGDGVDRLAGVPAAPGDRMDLEAAIA